MYSSLGTEELLKKLDTSLEGVTKEQAEKSLDIFGKNIITHGKKKSFFKKIVEAFVNPFTVVLFCLALVSTVTDMIIPWYSNTPEDFSPITVIIITIWLLSLDYYVLFKRKKVIMLLKAYLHDNYYYFS